MTTEEKIKQVFDTVTCFGSREMTFERFKQAVGDLDNKNPSLPTYKELVYAFKETHNLYLDAVKDSYMSHDITRVMANDNIFNRLAEA